MDRLRQDLRFALRALLRAPLVTLAAIVSLGLGIGAVASIFGAVDVFMIRPLAFPDSDRLIQVWTANAERGMMRGGVSVPDYLDWRAASRTLDLAAYGRGGANLSGVDQPQRLSYYRVSANFMSVLGVQPLLGRGFRAEAERIGGPRVVILGDGLWRRDFGADPGIIGRTIQLDGEPYEVAGVMPPRIGFGQDPDIWLPFRWTGAEARDQRGLLVLGRLRPGSDIPAARSELNAIQARLAERFPAADAGNSATMLSLQNSWFDEGFRQAA